MEPTRLLRDLIALPSVNPAFLPAGDPRAGEQRVADYVAALAARAGLELDFQQVLPGRRNVLARLTPREPVSQRVILAPHLDTVGAEGNQLEPRRRGGRMHGRGACDTKGSVAAMLTALTRVATSGARPATTEVVLAALVDEENAQSGSRKLARSGLRADLAIVGEPTELKVVTAHKGDLWLRLATHGKAAHGARPELGVNAVHAMARILTALEEDYIPGLGRRRHALLGRPTLNVGAIRGGQQPNIVPDRCEIDLDRRTLPSERDRAVVADLRAWLKREGFEAELVDVKGAPCPPLDTDPRLPLVRTLLTTAGQAGPAGVDFFCDAAILARGGIPSVVFGPGDIAQAHTADEWIALRSLEDAADLLTRYLRSLP